jgi:hypothetical protein
VLGDHDSVRRFVTEATQRIGGVIQPKSADAFLLNPSGALLARLKQRTGLEFPLLVSFSDQRVNNAVQFGEGSSVALRDGGGGRRVAFVPRYGAGYDIIFLVRKSSSK